MMSNHYTAGLSAVAEIKSTFHEKINVEQEVRVIVSDLILMSKQLCINIILKSFIYLHIIYLFYIYITYIY